MTVLSTKRSALLFFMGALFLFGLPACAPTKPSVQADAKSEQTKLQGVVTNEFAKDGCPWLVTYQDGTEEKYLIPVQLEERFKKNGLKLAFTFHYSRIMQADCQMGQPAVLEEIEVK